VQAAYDRNGIHIEGTTATRRSGVIKPCYITVPIGVARNPFKLQATEARYVPPGEGPRSGGWLLIGTEPADMDHADLPPSIELIDPGKYFVKTREVDFETVTRSRKWYQFASTRRLFDELSKPDSTKLAPMAVLFHARLTRPLLGIILVVLG